MRQLEAVQTNKQRGAVGGQDGNKTIINVQCVWFVVGCEKAQRVNNQRSAYKQPLQMVHATGGRYMASAWSDTDCHEQLISQVVYMEAHR